MSSKVITLTPKILKQMINEEMGKMKSVEKVAKEVPEVDAADYAETIAKDIDYIKALKIQEERLINKLNKVNEAKSKLRIRILKKLR